MEHAVEGLGSPALGRGHTYSTGKQTSSGFGAVLQQELARADERQIAFSKHAIARAEERGIAVTPALLDRLTDSVERAQAQGSDEYPGAGPEPRLYHQCPPQPGDYHPVPGRDEGEYLYQH